MSGAAKVTLWHNPRCSKSRAALELLTQAGADVTLRLYLTDPPDLAALRAAHKALNRPLADMLRPCEPAFREQGLSLESDADTLLNAMAQCPRLIERPIAFARGRAVIGRPPETVLSLL